MLNALDYAYIGDAVYELYIRKYLISSGLTKVSELTKASLKYVSAKSQRTHLERLFDKQFLSEKEIELIKYGRNAKGTKSKSADIITYRLATGLECLIGYLHYNNQEQRIIEIINFIVERGESIC